MSERLINTEVLQDFLSTSGYQPELFAAQLEMCMTNFRFLIKTGKLPKRRKMWRLTRITEITGFSMDQILIPEEERQWTA